jgi:very-short-patch-repair endonuclease
MIISRYANRQHGGFTRSQALEAGFSSSAISRRRISGLWEGVDHIVYRLAGTPSSWKQQLMAACLAGPAVASHRAAAILWEFPGMPADIIEVTALRHQRRRASHVTWHESRHLTKRDVTEVDRVPVTRPVRTFLDLGVVLNSNQLEEVLDNGLRRNLLDIAAIWRRVDELGDLRPGSKRVRGVLGFRVAGDRPAESVLETRFRHLVRGAGLPMPTPQFEIRVNGSTARVDFAYPEFRLAIELDGAAYHSSSRARGRDRLRENQLVALGWRVLRFTWEDVRDQPAAVLNAMRCVQEAC